ncbi:hypothetical protein M3Y97_00185100 [Aphelenchoides bicaudatus]|nr:hypothetical protein M3Y97_00185100 [Aphelenchoides bicaudatus]
MTNTCFGGSHVHRGAFLIGIIGIVASVITECFYFNEPVRVYFHIALSLVAFFCYIGILLAYHSERVIFYTPFFFIIPVCILAQLFNALLIFFVVGFKLTTGERQAVADPDLSSIYQFVKDNRGFTYDALRPPSVWVIILGVVFLVSACIQAYFYSVIVRAARYLQKLGNSTVLGRS